MTQHLDYTQINKLNIHEMRSISSTDHVLIINHQ